MGPGSELALLLFNIRSAESIVLSQVMELNHPLALSSPATTVLGRFAKLIQASHLLGKVLNHVADQRLGGVFYDEVTAQLDRTLRSLIQVSRSGEFSEQIPFCAQINICYR